jgi:DNA polymerase elongation subunit (family B)
MKNFDLETTLVLDIETVPLFGSFNELSSEMQALWSVKSNSLQKRNADQPILSDAETFSESAGIYSEFGKIVCISVGIFKMDKSTSNLTLHLKSYYGDDEHQLLLEFKNMLVKYGANKKGVNLCGHNIREFDIPYICRRMIINNIELPDILSIHGKKTWELDHLVDTLTLWKFGDYKAYTSLKLLCAIFNIPTPKDDIDGSEVGKTYWKDKDLERIETYCKKDVVATARVFLRLQLKDPFSFEVRSAD